MAEDFTGCMVAYACLLDFVSLWVYVLQKMQRVYLIMRVYMWYPNEKNKEKEKRQTI